MSNPNEYHIERVKDLLAIPYDKLDDCLMQLRSWAKHMAYLQAIKKAYGPTFAAAVDSMSEHGFVFVDDGLDGCSGVRMECDGKGAV
jgi:hypothetical protein